MGSEWVILCVFVWIVVYLECAPQEVTVTCLYSGNCLLPCEFPSATAAVIHWQKKSTDSDIIAHSYYHNNDQLNSQDPQYWGRTELNSVQVQRGNASLVLKNVTISDTGRYQCYTSTDLGNQESFVNLKVEAPIKSPTIEFRKEKGDNEVVCKSSEVYPEPHVEWLVIPEVVVELKNSTNKVNMEGLYNVERRLKIPDGPSNYTYICAINSEQQKWRLSLRKQVIEGFEDRNLKIPCTSPGDNLENFTLTWSFRNGSTFLRFNNRTKMLENDWHKDTQLDMQSLYNGDGSLVLVNPKSSKHAGSYTCRIEATERLHLIQTDVVIVTATKQETAGLSAGAIVGIVIAVAILLILAIILGHNWYKFKETIRKYKKAMTHPGTTDKRYSDVPQSDNQQSEM